MLDKPQSAGLPRVIDGRVPEESGAALLSLNCVFGRVDRSFWSEPRLRVMKAFDNFSEDVKVQ